MHIILSLSSDVLKASRGTIEKKTSSQCKHIALDLDWIAFEVGSSYNILGSTLSRKATLITDNRFGQTTDLFKELKDQSKAK